MCNSTSQLCSDLKYFNLNAINLHTLTSGLRSFRADAIPQMCPPPPNGAITVSTLGRSSKISKPMVPFPRK